MKWSQKVKFMLQIVPCQIVFFLNLSKWSLLLLLPLVLVVHGENDHQFPEDGNEIQEEIHTMPNIVLISILCLLNDELGVKQDKATHDKQPQIHMHLKEHDWAQEYVHQKHQRQEGKARHQCASEKQITPAFSIEGTKCEANEDDRGSQEGCHNDARVDSDDEVQGGAKANTC